MNSSHMDHITAIFYTASRMKYTLTILLLLGSPLANSVTILVDNRCTLEDALRASHEDAKIGACRAGSGVDTIILPANGHYVIPIQDEVETGHSHRNDPSTVKSTVIIRGRRPEMKLPQSKNNDVQLT